MKSGRKGHGRTEERGWDLTAMENEAEGQGLTQVGVVVTRQNRVLI